MGTLAPGGIRRLLHHPGAFTVAMLAYVGVAFAVEPFAGRGGELAIGLTTWLALLISVRSSSPSERAQVAAAVLISRRPTHRAASPPATAPSTRLRCAPRPTPSAHGDAAVLDAHLVRELRSTSDESGAVVRSDRSTTKPTRRAPRP